MSSATVADSRLSCRRFRAEYLTARDHPHPERVRARLDETAGKDLPNALAGILPPLLRSADPTIWLIRRLKIEMDVNAAWDRHCQAKHWAAHIARALSRTLSAGADGRNVLKFEGPASLFARFLVDLSEGRAWSKWYYERFEGFRMLPTSTALRTAMEADPSTARAALHELGDRERIQVLKSMTAQDARRVLDRMSQSPASEHRPAEVQLPHLRAVGVAWSRTGPAFVHTREESRLALELYLSVCRSHPGLSGPALRSAVLSFICSGRVIAGRSIRRRNEILTSLSAGDIARLDALLPPADVEALVPLLGCPREWLEEVTRDLLGQASPPPQRAEARASSVLGGELRETAFGGMFLLLPFLDELPLERLAKGWPRSANIRAVTLLRFVLLLKCLGHSQAHRGFRDPVVRDLLAIDPGFSVADLRRWETRVTPRNVEALLHEHRAWRQDNGTVGETEFVLARVSRPGWPVGLLIDSRRGVWLFACRYRSSRTQDLMERLTPFLRQRGKGVTLVISDDTLAAPLRAEYPPISIVEVRDSSISEMTKKNQVLEGILLRREYLPRDLSYLSLPGDLCEARALDLALSVPAQGILRDFSWKLPGFAGSSLPYLYRNFLDFDATVEEEPDRRVVRLGRPPLDLVLNMTGMARKTYRIRWLDERPLSLFPRGTP